MLVVLDEYTRKNIAIEVSHKLKSHDVIMVLDELTAICGAPENIRSDNVSEFIAKVIKESCKESGTNTLYIEPGAPWQNRIVESFNCRLRDELLLSEIFTTLAEAQLLCAIWRTDYNHRRPQRARWASKHQLNTRQRAKYPRRKGWCNGWKRRETQERRHRL